MPKEQIDGFRVNAVPDIPDFRDRYYEPALMPLKKEIAVPEGPGILDQGKEGACTGFGLAAVVNLLYQRQESDVRVSARMLYEMARKFDEWPGEEYAGSSCRGAIKGWYSMGVCREELAPYRASDKNWHLTVERAKDARANAIGAYYRLRKNIVDMHAAMNEVGVIFVSANVHSGWRRRSIKKGRIQQSKNLIGAHAFAIVGYDATGFWVQNSWGESWGLGGLAHWSYVDWQENVKDAWVVRLALPTPELGERWHDTGAGAKAGLSLRGPRRDAIAGHFVHIDDGEFHDSGKYWSNLQDVKETAALVAKSTDYSHLLVYAHGGLNSPKASATRIAAMKEVFKANRIYPFHFMYDTGLLEELKDIILGKRSTTEDLVGGFSDWWDRRFEQASRIPGRALWREMKGGARAAFEGNGTPGSQTMGAFLSALAADGAKPKKIHLVGHSTGAILIAHLLKALARKRVRIRIASVSLMAPAATVELFESHYRPLLTAAKTRFGIDKMNVYNLSDELEQDDDVAKVYRKSLLYLVSNAFEEERSAGLLGMSKFADDIPPHSRLTFVESKSKKRGRRSRSSTHGAFDNDRYTLNDLLETVLGKDPQRPFKKSDLDY